ncbi:haloacid dehalogenase [Parasulfuritortus cantonensis]|uniref:Haloacid dehalogenase n=1 Tax=Parasulfuritortus cantonensis TaxID=2528202 RepID=A0A4R1BC86_9PROT|nr:HAD hydrolase-like protein [Parasulfuritortus cantonensis]TCJ14646.1 haloacid dehalogenase [Parasulfuritortus cantonensis]
MTNRSPVTMAESIAASFADLLHRYDAVLLDAYGVLVDLAGALPGAAAWIDTLNRLDKPYWLVSNTAARLPESAARRYQGFGLAIPAERILSSGMLLVPYFAEHGLAGQRVRVLGPEDSAVYAERAGGRLVGAGEEFDVLVLADQAGFPFLDGVDEVLSVLIDRFDAGQDVAMVLPNPDLIYPTGRGCGITSGAMAVMLEAALRQRYPERPAPSFARLGKPYPGLFAEAVRLAGTRNVVMVGDQLDTDIVGATRFGIDSALVPGVLTGDRRRVGGVAPTYLLAPPGTP